MNYWVYAYDNIYAHTHTISNDNTILFLSNLKRELVFISTSLFNFRIRKSKLEITIGAWNAMQ